MLKNFFIVTLIVGSLTWSYMLLAHGQTQIPFTKPVMSTVNGVLIKNISLMAREEKKQPPGTQQVSPRDIGFASVFFHIENTTQANINVIIEAIEIRNSDNKTILKQATPEEIILKPLEDSKNSFHLTNKLGIPGSGKVKAVLTYRIGDRTEVIESALVNVDRF
ncbi:hypothetical protein F7734_19285 [Scytonema sp. UIC 10036]|nr:hypothetical protein [Scytonema sp. UIC 10036]